MEDGPPPPALLTFTEERIIAGLREGVPDAEIAVRLGLTVGELKARIERMQARFETPDRAALAWCELHDRVAEQAPGVEAQPQPGVAEATPRESRNRLVAPEPVARGSGANGQGARRLSRRGVLVAGGFATAASLAGGALALLARGGQPEPEELSAAPAPTPTPGSPHLAVRDLVTEVVGAFEREHYLPATENAPGSPIPWEHGIFFMSSEHGEISGYRLRRMAAEEAEWADGSEYRTFAPGLAISCSGGDRPFGWLHYRGSGESFRWLRRDLNLRAASPQHLLFERASGPSAREFSGEYVLVEHETFAEVSRFSLEPGIFSPSPIFSPDGAFLALWSTSEYTAPVLHMVETASGFSRLAYRAEAERDHFRAAAGELSHHVASGGLEFRVRNVRFSYPFDPRRFVFPPEEFSGTIGWGGTAGDVRRVGLFESESPLGGVTVRENYLRAGNPALLGADAWPVVDVDTLDGTSVRLQSAALSYGDRLAWRRWLADGSGFFAAVRDQEVPGDLGYALYSPRGEVVEQVRPLAIEGEERWFERGFMRGPIPSPDDSKLVSLGRIELQNLWLGAKYRANLATGRGPEHLDPWATGHGREMVFALPHSSHDTPPLPLLLDPRATKPVAASELAFVVARSGGCMEVWPGPRAGAGSEALACLPDGTPVAMVEDDDAETSLAYDDAGERWVRIADAQGLEGWARVSGLDWA